MTIVEVLPLLVPLLGVTGVFGAVIRVMYRLHGDAVQSQRERADDWRKAYELKAAEATERERQLQTIIAAVTQKTGSAA